MKAYRLPTWAEWLGYTAWAVLIALFTWSCRAEASWPVLGEPACDVVAAIELNHFYDEAGREVFSQVIFWGSDLPYPNRVREWRMVAKVQSLPPYHDGREWVLTWFDDDVMREIRSPSYIETWTQYDPEVADRAFVPPAERLGFRTYPPSKPFVLEHPPEGP